MSEENKQRDQFGREGAMYTRGENEVCGTYTPAYREMIRKREEILSKLTDGIDLYQTNTLWQKVVDSMACGADPLQIIEQLMVINISQAEQIIKKALSEPMRGSIMQIPGAVIWQPVDKNNLPSGTVLAKNTVEVHLGVLQEIIEPYSCIECISEEFDTISLMNVTHYITIENLLKL